jgi:hypothetical protein
VRIERTHEDLKVALSYTADEMHRCATCAARRQQALAEDYGVVADACLEAKLVHARSVPVYCPRISHGTE